MHLYVSNLEMSVSDTELSRLFAPYGRVIFAKIMPDRKTGHSSGAGFVEMNWVDAFKAMSELNGTLKHGRKLSVTEAKF